MPNPLDPLSDHLAPEDYRRRYEELKAQGQTRADWRPDLAPGNPDELPERAVRHFETIPAGWYWTAKLKRGDCLRLVSGGSAISAQFWNAADTSERYNAGDTVKIQWTAQLGKGRLLFSDMGRVMLSITDATTPWHDTLLGGSTARSNVEKYPGGAVRNSRDNFILAAGKLGLGKRDTHPAISFFAGVRVREDGSFAWVDNAVTAGDRIDLRAEMDVLLALSNCPHPLDPAPWPPQPAQAILWRAPKAAADDFCRNATGEAQRGFDNTDALFQE